MLQRARMRTSGFSLSTARFISPVRYTFFIMILNFPVPTEKITWIKHFVEENSLEIIIEGRIAHMEFLETYQDGIMEALATFEADYENETQDKILELKISIPEEDR
jgi:hypothetical protein